MPRLENLLQVVLWKVFCFKFCFFTFLLFALTVLGSGNFPAISNPGLEFIKNRHLLRLRGSPLFTTANHDPKGAGGRKNARTPYCSPLPPPNTHNPNSSTRKIKMRFPKAAPVLRTFVLDRKRTVGIQEAVSTQVAGLGC